MYRIQSNWIDQKSRKIGFIIYPTMIKYAYALFLPLPNSPKL